MKEDFENTGWVLENKHSHFSTGPSSYKPAKSIDTGALEGPILANEQMRNRHVTNLHMLFRERAKKGLELQRYSSQMTPYLKPDRAVFG